MSQIAVRLSESELRDLDSLVEDGGFATRAEAVRAGIRMLGGAARERRIAASYADAYGRSPLSAQEAEMLDAAADLVAELGH